MNLGALLDEVTNDLRSRQVTLVRTQDNRWQCSVQNGGSFSYTVVIMPTAAAALELALGQASGNYAAWLKESTGEGMDLI